MTLSAMFMAIGIPVRADLRGPALVREGAVELLVIPVRMMQRSFRVRCEKS